MKILLLGAGSDHKKRVRYLPQEGEEWEGELTTLDNNPSHHPDVVWDLNKVPWPFNDNSFDRVDAYEVLEHLGTQGDAEAFFAHFYEIWRILKRGGVLVATVPHWNSLWAWGDPSHRRVINQGTLVFLDQDQYTAQVGHSPMSDFRHIWKGNFKAIGMEERGEQFVFVLKVVK